MSRELNIKALKPHYSSRAVGSNKNMKTKNSLRINVLMPITLALLTGIFAFSLLVFYKTYQNPEFTGLIIGLLFMWVSIGIGSVLVDEIKTFEIKGQKLIIRKPLLLNKTIKDISHVKYTEYDWGESVYRTKMNGILIKIDDEKTIQLNKSNYKNAPEFISLLKSKCTEDRRIKMKSNYRKLIIVAALGAVILILIALDKVS